MDTVMKRFIFFTLSLLMLIGCQQPPERLLRIGTNVWPGYEPLYLARELNMFEAGTRLNEYPSASEVIRAFRNRSLEVASLTLDEALLLRQSNIPIKIVLIHDISEGADVIVARKGIGSIEELKGKRVGVESAALGAYVITRALEIHNMKISDVELVNLDVNLHEEAFRNGRIDAAVTFEPVRTHLLNMGGEEIFSSSEIPNEIVDVMVVHEDVFERSPERVARIVDAWFEAVRFLRDNQQKAAKMISERLNITPQEVIESYHGLTIPDRVKNRALLSGEAPGLERTMKKIQTVLEQNGLVRKGIDIEGVITDQVI